MDIGRSLNEAWEGFFGFLPNLLGSLVLLVVGYVVARLVGTGVRKVLDRVGVDRRLRESAAHGYVGLVLSGAAPSRVLGRVVFWVVFAFFLVSAIGALGVPALTAFVNDVLAYLPNVVVAIAIFVLAAVVAGVAAAAVGRVLGGTPTGRIVASVVPAVVMIIAMFMILEQLRIAEEIVRIAFAATMFALALGLALAFGLGGRDLAGRMLEDAYRAGKEQSDLARRDPLAGASRSGSHRASADGHGGHATGYATASFSPAATSPHPAPGGRAQPAGDPGATQAWSPDSPQSRL